MGAIADGRCGRIVPALCTDAKRQGPNLGLTRDEALGRLTGPSVERKESRDD